MTDAHADWPVPARIEGVIFDVHSTLLDQGSASDWLDLALAHAPHPMDPERRTTLVAFLDRIWEGARVSDPTSSRDLSPEAHARVFHDLIDAGPGVDRSLSEALYDTLLDTWRAYDDAVPTLVALRDLGQRICLVSNAGLPIRDILDRDGIGPLCDGIVLSYEVGAVKPDPLIFQSALAALELPASAVLMVGDNAYDDGGGTALGIRTLILPRTAGRIHGLAAVPALVAGVNATFG